MSEKFQPSKIEPDIKSIRDEGSTLPPHVDPVERNKELAELAEVISKTCGDVKIFPNRNGGVTLVSNRSKELFKGSTDAINISEPIDPKLL